MLELARTARDRLFDAATRSRRTTFVDGIELSLDDMSARMRYVMCHGYESGDAQLASRIVDAHDSVLEAGSGIGFIALYCIRKLGVRNYTMVEANPGLAAIIRKNFDLNAVACPSIVTAAVAAQDGEVSFNVSPDFWASSALGVQSGTRITVPALSIPTLLARMPYQPTTLVMDIEGSEADIPPVHFAPFRKIVMETHGRLVGTKRIDALLAGLEEAGFRRVARNRDSYALARDGDPVRHAR